jgi:ferredoxin
MLTAPSFRAERCVRYRYAYSECNRCAEACPHEAIRLFDAGVEIINDLCQSCALCVAVCPTEALTEKSVSAESLLKIAGDAKQMTIACAPSGTRGDAVVPCLGAINAVVLADFSRRGIVLQLAGTGHCAECAHVAKGPDLIQLNLAARAVLCDVKQKEGEEWAVLTLVEAEAQEPAEDKELAASRRHLFRKFVSHGVEAVTESMEAPPPPPLKAIRAAAPFLPERKIILNALYVAQGEEPVRVARHPAIPAEDWSIVQERCTNCEACIRVCPTGALQLLDDNKAWRVVLLNERCVACDVCVEVCQPKVLYQRDKEQVIANKQKARLLRSVPKKRCTTCDRLFVTEGDSPVCPICIMDDGDFEKIFS